MSTNRSKRRRVEEPTTQKPIIQNDEVRIVLVGKTGAGKSAAGNTFLGEHIFESIFTPTSVTSDCRKANGKVSEQKVSVVDTPGLYDTKLTEKEIQEKIKRCISLSAPGPHVFLVVVQLGRFTPEEQETVKLIQKTFGEMAANYTMALFTHGDKLKGKHVEYFVSQSPPELHDFVQKCNGGYHAFNNKDGDRSQVTQLLEKINTMVRRNGGKHYTTEMFQQAERAIEKEKERILKENEAKRHEEIMKLRSDLEQEFREKEEKIRMQREEKEKEERKAREEEFKKEMEKLRKDYEHKTEMLVAEREKHERERRSREKREEAERRSKFEEERQRKEQEQKDKHESDARRKAEQSNEFVGVLAGTVAGASTGACIGSLVGPAGAVVGAAVGGAAGAVGAAVKHKKCVIQ